jgi:type I restriction enzyme S subunit
MRPRNGLLADFLASIIASPGFTNHIQRVTTGTAVPHISAKQIGDFKFRLPEPRIQAEIGGTLAALDDRIALLRETNATLEAIAQALFKSWFFDFDPVRTKMGGRDPDGMDETTAALFPDALEGEARSMPRGWQAATLGEVFEINPPRLLKKGTVAPYLDMAGLATSGHCVEKPILRPLGSGAKFRNGDALLARITPCLENGKSAFVDFLDDDQVGWGSTEFIVLRPKDPLPAYLGYLLCRHPPFREYAVQSMSGTSGRQRVQNDVLGKYPLVLPTEDVVRAFAAIIDPIQRGIAANHASARTLGALRDALLPRLISGQLRISEIERQLDEALVA